MAIHTPAGVIVHTGDFKVDYTPVDDSVIDLARFGELGNRGVLALLTDSTNAERPGFTPSERNVGKTFETLFDKAESKRIIIATFSSNIHRIQQIINSAARHGRKVAVSGRSMLSVMGVAMELGYLKVPENMLIELEEMDRYSDNEIVLITTGSQGEAMSALTRMAMNEHRSVKLTPNDYVIISAKPIPGNEKYVNNVVNSLMKTGAKVVYESMYDVHVSGHACQEELKLIYTLCKPKFYMPMHGEYKHLVKNAALARELGCDKDNIVIAEIGNVIETDGVTMKVVSQVQAGKVLVDGAGVGDVGSIVLRDRKHLSEDGIIIVVLSMQRSESAVVSGPDIISRGFVYVRESEELMEESKKILRRVIDESTESELRDWNSLKQRLRDSLSEYIYIRTKRSPMILPIIMEV
jgi:ribonuclease J